MFKIENSVFVLIDFQEKLVPAIYDNKELEKKVAIFVKGCRLLDVPILTVQNYTKGMGDTTQAIKDALVNTEYTEKMSFSCCGCPEFVAKLKETGRKNVIVAGVETHICVQQTVFDLMGIGYNVYVLADCSASRKEADRLYSEETMRAGGARITTYESVLFELMVRADHPKRKEVSNLVK